jgi:MATE family multidrug resistance protein
LNFGLLGTLIGLGEARRVLSVQLVLNGINVALDLALTVGLSLGIAGVALGTAIAQWFGFAWSLWLVTRRLRQNPGSCPWFGGWALLSLAPLWRTLRESGDIMLRTLFLLAGFAWFTKQSARLGSEVLAANHVLLQFVSFAAFFLDGYAHVAETFAGRASGARDLAGFDRAVRRTTELSVVTGLGLGALFFLLRALAIRSMTDIASVVEPALRVSAFTALYIGLSSVAFQLDGIFIGTTSGRALRNAALASFVGFWLLSTPLSDRWGNPGLWLSFVLFVLLRALSLGIALPALRRRVARPS